MCIPITNNAALLICYSLRTTAKTALLFPIMIKNGSLIIVTHSPYHPSYLHQNYTLLSLTYSSNHHIYDILKIHAFKPTIIICTCVY